MQIVIKILLSLLVIVAVAFIGRSPSLAGLIATMPLAGVLALVWLYTDNRGDNGLITSYTRSALWGVIPSLLFYAAALVCFKRHWPLPAVLGMGFAVWAAAAAVHQWLLR